MLSVASLFHGTAPGSARSARTARRSLAAREEERRRLDEAMQELPELPRLALALRYFESARPRQIAVVLGIPEEKIEAVLADAVRAVTEILQRPAELSSAPTPSRARRVPSRRGSRS